MRGHLCQYLPDLDDPALQPSYLGFEARRLRAQGGKFTHPGEAGVDECLPPLLKLLPAGRLPADQCGAHVSPF